MTTAIGAFLVRHPPTRRLLLKRRRKLARPFCSVVRDPKLSTGLRTFPGLLSPCSRLLFSAYFKGMAAADAEVRDTARYAQRVRAALSGGDLGLGLEAMVQARFGAGAIRTAPIREEAVIATVHGQQVIFTSDALTPKRARWCVAHAFASWLLEYDGVPQSERRKLRASLAAELLLPMAACPHLFPTAHAPTLADALKLPLSFVLLREAEIFRKPTALVVPGSWARVLGDDHGRLPPELSALELLASRRGIGVQRWDVPEDRGTVIRVAA